LKARGCGCRRLRGSRGPSWWRTRAAPPSAPTHQPRLRVQEFARQQGLELVEGESYFTTPKRQEQWQAYRDSKVDAGECRGARRWLGQPQQMACSKRLAALWVRAERGTVVAPPHPQRAWRPGMHAADAPSQLPATLPARAAQLSIGSATRTHPENAACAPARGAGHVKPDEIVQPPGPVPPEVDQTQTVGAVAVDSQGRLAAATSTGGRTGKMEGRVGDTPMIGAGGQGEAHPGRGGGGVCAHCPAGCCCCLCLPPKRCGRPVSWGQPSVPPTPCAPHLPGLLHTCRQLGRCARGGVRHGDRGGVHPASGLP
jgi:hypothetical protein